MLSERYQLQKRLGGGQMSEVWLAQDTFKHEQVAFKIMKAITEDDRRNQKARERFHREIEITRSLQHPHILPILDYGYTAHEQRRVPYLVSPYMRDGSLADLIKKSPPWQSWTLRQMSDVIMQAAESLWCLHTHTPPIVHEDVKPANFLIRELRQPERMAYLYLCDFGISRWKQSASTTASELLGTFAYMAPEQIDGRVELASDQYALGIMACFILSGKLPIQAATNDLYAFAHRCEEPLAPSILNPERGYSSAVDEVILRALEKSPELRYPSIRDFARALSEALQHDEQEQASAQTVRALDLSQANPANLDERSVLHQMPSTPPKSSSSNVPDVSVVHEARAKSDIYDAPIVLDPPDAEDERVLDDPLPARPVRALNTPNNDVSFLSPLDWNVAKRIVLPARPKLCAWSPDGLAIACILYGHIPVFLHPNGTIQEVQTRGAERAGFLCWSPDGQILALAAQGEVTFWDCREQCALPLTLRFNVRVIESMDWSRREQLAIWVEDQLLIYHITTTALKSVQPPVPQRFTTHGLRSGNMGALRWSPDGRALAVGAANGAVRCWRMDQAAGVWEVAQAGQKVSCLAWSPDSSLLAVAFRDQRVAGWTLGARSPAFVWEKLPAMPRALSFALDNRLALASSEHRILLGFPGDVAPPLTLPGQLLSAWSPGQPTLLTLDEQRDHVLVLWHP